jgi:benzodiazapine receptor
LNKKKLNKPSWNPPPWLYAPVWAVLKASMGYSSYLIYSQGQGVERSVALGLYGSQLLFNWVWTPIYFGAHKLGLVKLLNTKFLG